MSAKIALPNASLSNPSSCSQTASSTQSRLLVTGATLGHPQTIFRGANAGGWNAHVTRRIVRFVEETVIQITICIPRGRLNVRTGSEIQRLNKYESLFGRSPMETQAYLILDIIRSGSPPIWLCVIASCRHDRYRRAVPEWYKNKLHRKIRRIGRLSSGDTRAYGDRRELKITSGGQESEIKQLELRPPRTQEYEITRRAIQHLAAFLPNQIAFFQNRSNTSASSQNTPIAATSNPAPPTLRCVIMAEQAVSGLLLLRLPSRHSRIITAFSQQHVSSNKALTILTSSNASNLSQTSTAKHTGRRSVLSGRYHIRLRLIWRIGWKLRWEVHLNAIPPVQTPTPKRSQYLCGVEGIYWDIPSHTAIRHPFLAKSTSRSQIAPQSAGYIFSRRKSRTSANRTWMRRLEYMRGSCSGYDKDRSVEVDIRSGDLVRFGVGGGGGSMACSYATRRGWESQPRYEL
ncbi:hypothetical protein M422DRAFT_261519 [Sphaerobolus stellatus SS14]|uniref:Uncharacterized protein n=1 Tax=Sphaerobolus stellatus (strain SS14) TaxID=990650 RepID=A0A0C9U0A1_SPHS4|nr:hypothetical protein M422DRAFT_261519 [Sphaerobolus stellatus SS14]